MLERMEKHPRLMAIYFITSLITVIIGCLLIIDVMQHDNRNKKAIPELRMELPQESYKAYNIDGLSEEEIQSLIENGREEVTSGEIIVK